MNIKYKLNTRLWEIKTIHKYLANYKVWKYYWEEDRHDYSRRPNSEFFLALTTMYSMEIVDYKCARFFRSTQTERGKYFL